MRLELNAKTASLLTLMLVACMASAANAQNSATVAAEQLKRLEDGNKRYVDNRAQRSGQRPVGGDQTPIAAVLSCSDARVPPEILFDQGVNDLFVVRVAGNTAGDPVAHPAVTDTAQLQSLAYAVQSLKVKLIVVLGHVDCGAVKGALAHCGPSSIGPMFQNICPAVRRIAASSIKNPQEWLRPTMAGNIQDQVNLLKSTPPFADMVKNKELRIVGGFYEIGTGHVSMFLRD